MKSLVFLITILFSNILIAHENEKPPELWTWFKDLEKPKDSCVTQSFYALTEVGVENMIKNEHGFYGNIKNNKIVVKCLSIEPRKSKVLVAVAGSSPKSVESLRNRIINLIK